jgi:hypothetical protein
LNLIAQNATPEALPVAERLKNTTGSPRYLLKFPENWINMSSSFNKNFVVVTLNCNMCADYDCSQRAFRFLQEGNQIADGGKFLMR